MKKDKKDEVELDSDVKFVARIDPKLKAYYEANSLSGQSLGQMALDVTILRQKMASLEGLSVFASLIGTILIVVCAILLFIETMVKLGEMSLASVLPLLLSFAMTIISFIVGDLANRKVRKIQKAKRVMIEIFNELREYVSRYGFVSVEADLTEQKGLMFDEGFMRRSVETMAYSVLICEDRFKQACASFDLSVDNVERIRRRANELISFREKLDEALAGASKFGLKFERGEIFAAARWLIN